MSQEIGLPKCRVSNGFLKGIEMIRYFCIGNLDLALGVACLELVARCKDLRNFDFINDVNLAISGFLQMIERGFVRENVVCVLSRFMMNEQKSSADCFDLLKFYVENESFCLRFIESGFRDIVKKILPQESFSGISLGEGGVEGIERILFTVSRGFHLCIKFFDVNRKIFKKFSPSEPGWYLKVYIICYDNQFSIGYSRYMNIYDDEANRNNKTIFKLFSKVKANESEQLVNKIGTVDYAIYNKSLMKSMSLIIECLLKKEIFNEGIMKEIEKCNLQDENQGVGEYLKKCREIRNNGKFICCSVCGDFGNFDNFEYLGCIYNCKVYIKCIECYIEKCEVCNKSLTRDVKEFIVMNNMEKHRMSANK